VRVIFLGSPQPLGGANTERYATAILFRRMSLAVTVIPAWGEPPGNPYPSRLREAGCEYLTFSGPDDIQLPHNSTVVMMCSPNGIRAWPRLRDRGCKLIWSPCMTRVQHYEREVFDDEKCPPTAVHFQSQYQRQALAYFYLPFIRPIAIIPGAFERADFPYRPRLLRGRTFTIGKLARPHPDKWPEGLWSLGHRLRARGIDTRMNVMGWNPQLDCKCGPPPAWAAALPPNVMQAFDFLRPLDAMLGMQGGDVENWPRVGLEAMASGVPIVADNSGGWPEMLGEAGSTVGSEGEAVDALERLARDDRYRVGVIERAYERMKQLTDWRVLAAKWQEIFDAIR